MKIRLVWLTTVLLIVLIGFSSSRAQDYENILMNGGFEDGVLEPWTTYGVPTAEVVTTLEGAAVPEDPIEGDYCLHIAIDQAGANFWDSWLKYTGLVFEQGKQYTFSAFMKTDQGEVQILFKPELDANPWTGYGEQSFFITEEWTEYSTTTPVFTQDVDPADVVFLMAYTAGNFWIDHVRFYEGEYVEPVFIKRTSASKPIPKDGTVDVCRDVVISWTPGEFANTHDVYFGTSLADVNDATASDPKGVYKGRQDPNYYPISGTLDLELGQTYYWRVDEVNAVPDTIFKGDIWQFTAEPFALAVENVTVTASGQLNASVGPENTTNGSGLDSTGLLHGNTVNDNMWITAPGDIWIEFEFENAYNLQEMWVWNLNGEWITNFGIKDLIIEYSTDGTDYTKFGTTHEFLQAPGTASYAHNTTINLDGVLAKYVKIIASSNWGGGNYGLSEVRFLYRPMQARKPNPQDGATDVPIDAVLSWRAGRRAQMHNVYIRPDLQAVTDGTVAPISIPADGCAASKYGPLSLDLNRTYYWRVDEVNDLESPSMFEGDVWNFTTEQFLVVDDFEIYDINDNQIWFSWKDGIGYDDPAHPPAYGGNGTGSAVGDVDTDSYTEETIVNGGSQSMPYWYTNDGSTDKALYSEAELTFSPPQDWSKGGAKALSLWFYGDPNNNAGVTEQLYVKVNGAKTTYDGDLMDITEAHWHEWNIDLTDFGVGLTNVTTLAIGFGDEANTTPGGSGKVYFDDIRLYPARCVLSKRTADFARVDYISDCVVNYEELEEMGRKWLHEVTGPISTNLVGHYELEGNTNDRSGNNHTGTVQGSPAYVPGPAGLGQAMHFDGTSQGNYVDTGTWNPSAGTDKLSVTVWAKWDGLSGQYQGLIGKRNTWAAADMMWQVECDQTTGVVRAGREGIPDIQDSSFVLEIGEWEHVAFTFDGTTGVLYRNGEVVATGSYSFGGNPDAAVVFGAVEAGGGNPFNGALDDIRIYNYALSFQEIMYIAASRADLHPDNNIDFKDFAALGDAWLDEQMWP